MDKIYTDNLINLEKKTSTAINTFKKIIYMYTNTCTNLCTI